MTITSTEQSVVAGTWVRFVAQFTNQIDGSPQDPIEIVFAYAIDGCTTGQIEFGDSLVAPFMAFIRDSVGLYHCDVNTTGMAPFRKSIILTGQFAGGQGAPDSDPASAVGFNTITVNAAPIDFSF